MHEPGKSDSRTVPKKAPNKAGELAAEGLEGRRLAKQNSLQRTTLRTQGRERVHEALGRVRQTAERQKGQRFTALLHDIYAIDTLRAAFYELKRDAAPGVDGETWEHYGQDLEARLAELSDRVRRGAYRPQPVRRVYVPKWDGKQQRPIGVTAIEDKIVQRATVSVLNAVYEPEVAGFRMAHDQGAPPTRRWQPWTTRSNEDRPTGFWTPVCRTSTGRLTTTGSCDSSNTASETSAWRGSSNAG
jgi:hypothetical protein